MSWSVRRRIIYLLITLAIIGIVAFGVWYYYKPAPSCFDGIRNQDELGVDCGGLCPQVCPSETVDARVVWSRVFKVDEGIYDTAVYLENPNPHHGIKSLPYLIRIFDQNNILITTIDGHTFLNPKEQFVIFHSKLEVGKRVPARAIFEFTDTPVWQKVSRQQPALSINKKDFTNTPRPSLVATIHNESLENVKDLVVVATVSDDEQNVMAVSSTLVDTLDQGETKEIVFTWPKSFAAAPVAFDFYPHLDLSTLSGNGRAI
jgi:hypothetical protein